MFTFRFDFVKCFKDIFITTNYNFENKYEVQYFDFFSLLIFFKNLKNENEKFNIWCGTK